MMTSRAEFRLVLREDNTIDRLAEISFRAGLIDEADYSRLNWILTRRASLRESLDGNVLVPNEATLAALREIPTSVINKPYSYSDMMRREEFECHHLRRFGFDFDDDSDVVEPVAISIKYEVYIKRQNEMIDQFKRLENLCLPAEMDYGSVKGLSREEIEKLETVRPRSLGQAQRISGVNPSAVQAIMIHLKAKQNKAQLSGQR